MKKGIIQVLSTKIKVKGIVFFSFFSLSILSPCPAQTTKIWDKVLGSIYTENPVFISANPSGTVDVIASIAGAGNPAGNAQGFDVTTGYGKYDYWFCKLDRSGQKIPGTDRTYGGSENDEAISAIRTNDGGYLICGKSYSSPLPAANTSVLWVVKIDTMGAVQWKKQVDLHVAVPSGNGVCNLTGHMAACNTSTGYAIVVSTHSPGPTSNYFTFLVLYDLAGNQAPPVNINPGSSASTLNDIFLPRCISQMTNGNLLLGGSKNSRGHSIRLSGSGTTTIFATQLASNGASAIISAKELPTGRLLYFQKSIHDNLSGSSRTVSSKASSGNYDVWTFQTAANGSGFTNENALGCGSLNLADNASILELSNVFYNNNRAYLLLEPNATGLDRKGTNNGSTDYWLVEYDYINNKILKENSFGGSGAEQVQSLVLDNDFTNAYLLGTSASTISGDKTEALKSGTSDLWVVKSCLGAVSPTAAGSIFVWGTHFFMVCSGQKVSITLANTKSDYTYKWYDAASGGNLIFTGTSYTTPNISAVANWWVEPNNGICTGNRVPVSAVPITTPSTPTIFGNPLVCKGENVMLIARRDTAPQPGQSGQFFVSHWYDSTGTKLLSTRDTFMIPNIQKGIKLVLSTVDSIPPNPGFGWPAFTCESQKSSFAITVQDVPVPIVQFTNPDCIYTPTTLTVSNSNGNMVNWYDGSNAWLYSGNPLVYTNTTLTDIIYCELVSFNGCVSPQKQLTITAKYDTVPRPHFANTFFSLGQNIYPTCSNSSATINVKNPNTAFTYNWYDAPTGGNLVHVGTSLTVPNVNLNSHYEYYICANNGSCLSTSTDVLIQPIKTPGIPKIVSTVTTLCKNETLVLVAQKDTSTQPGGIFFNRWYNSSNQLLHTGDTLKVPNIQATSTFYCATVDSIPYNYFPNLGPYLCEGPKISQQIIVDSVPAPVVQYTNPTCIYNTTTLSILNGSGDIINWYNNSGNIINNGNPFVYSNTNNVDTLYCELISSIGCISKKTQLIIKVQHTLPSSPSFQNVYTQATTNFFPTCSNSSASINIKLPNTAFTYNWYDAPAAGNIVNVNSTYTISNVNYNGVYQYWVASNDGTCIGNRSAVKVKPIKTPGLPQIITPATRICRYETLVLIAQKDTSTYPGGIFFNRWYNSSNQLLHTGDTLKVPNIQTTSTFYCATVDSIPYNYFPNLGAYLCEGPKISKQIIVDTVINPIVKVPSPICKGFNIPLNVTNAVNCSIGWYGTNGGLLANVPSYTIPFIKDIDTIFTQAVGVNLCKSKKIQTIVTPENPSAAFIATKTILKSGDIIQFTNQSVGANKWAWNFGDGSTSTTQSPWHYFYNPGYYNIILIATSANGCIDTSRKNNYIQVETGIGVNEYSILKGVKIFPNPFTEGVWIDVPINLNTVDITLKNIMGQELRQYSIREKEFILLTDLSAGIYMLQIIKDNEILNIKIIKE